MMVEQEKQVLASIENSIDRAVQLAGKLAKLNRRLYERTLSNLDLLRYLVEQQAIKASFERRVLRAIEATEKELKELFPPWKGTE